MRSLSKWLNGLGVVVIYYELLMRDDAGSTWDID